MENHKHSDSISIVLRPGGVREYTNLIPNLISWLKRRKKHVQFLSRDQERVEKLCGDKSLKDIEFIEEKRLYSNSGLIISMGGDGTLIGVCRNMPPKGPPIFGVNLGNLGFITEFSKVTFFEDLAQYFEGKFSFYEMESFQAEVTSKGKTVIHGHFINDAVINKQSLSRIFKICVEYDEEKVYDLPGDGLIISTPVGSTAYSLAAGGPILHNSAQCLVLTPLCPHGLTYRPIVVPDQGVLKLQLLNKTDNVILNLDGQQTIAITYKDIIKISKDSRRSIRLVKNPNRTFFRTIKDKFMHA